MLRVSFDDQNRFNDKHITDTIALYTHIYICVSMFVFVCVLCVCVSERSCWCVYVGAYVRVKTELFTREIASKCLQNRIVCVCLCMLQHVAVLCSVVRCVAECRGVLQ